MDGVEQALDVLRHHPSVGRAVAPAADEFIVQFQLKWRISYESLLLDDIAMIDRIMPRTKSRYGRLCDLLEVVHVERENHPMPDVLIGLLATYRVPWWGALHAQHLGAQLQFQELYRLLHWLRERHQIEATRPHSALIYEAVEQGIEDDEALLRILRGTPLEWVLAWEG